MGLSDIVFGTYRGISFIIGYELFLILGLFPLFIRKSEYFQKNIYIDIEQMGMSDIVFGTYRGMSFMIVMNYF